LLQKIKIFKKGIEEAKTAGVEFSGCIACATNLGTVEKLTELNIELKGWGIPLPDIIKEKKHLVTV